MRSEDSYGTGKRLSVLRSWLDASNATTILDYGCGSGSVIAPLAETYRDKNFIGVDADKKTIDYAMEKFGSDNLHFMHIEELDKDSQFDLVIASEVIEHVESPGLFLNNVSRHVAANGQLFLSTPNGYGPFEIASFFESILKLTGIYRMLRSLKSNNNIRQIENVRDTHAISPHINFFSYNEIRDVISSSGFRIIWSQNRTLLCGLGFDQIIHKLNLVEWNANIADGLSPWLVSDWMFMLEHDHTSVNTDSYTRNAYARMRRTMNEKVAAKH